MLGLIKCYTVSHFEWNLDRVAVAVFHADKAMLPYPLPPEYDHELGMGRYFEFDFFRIRLDRFILNRIFIFQSLFGYASYRGGLINPDIQLSSG